MVQDLGNIIAECDINEDDLKIINLQAQGYKQGEIADLVNISQSTISRRIDQIVNVISQKHNNSINYA